MKDTRTEKRLSHDNWILLDNMMVNVPDPNETFTATGWHYRLTGLLGTFGIETFGRYDAYDVGKELWDMGYDYK